MIKLQFKGEVYSIPDNKAFEAGAEVEEIVTMAEIASWEDKPRFFTLARAIGALLRFAGAKASDREVKAEIDRSLIRIAEEDGDDAADQFLMGSIAQLQAVLFDGAPEDDEPGHAPEKAKASSKRRSKSR